MRCSCWASNRIGDRQSEDVLEGANFWKCCCSRVNGQYFKRILNIVNILIKLKIKNKWQDHQINLDLFKSHVCSYNPFDRLPHIHLKSRLEIFCKSNQGPHIDELHPLLGPAGSRKNLMTEARAEQKVGSMPRLNAFTFVFRKRNCKYVNFLVHV